MAVAEAQLRADRIRDVIDVLVEERRRLVSKGSDPIVIEATGRALEYWREQLEALPDEGTDRPTSSGRWE